ncbi:MAG TPA: Obg family GTPase CgtA, partial [Clostridia bacterium]
VDGSWVRRLVNSTNFGVYESLQYFQRAIKKKGIIDSLEGMGINEGDTVRVHDFEFTYVR